MLHFLLCQERSAAVTQRSRGAGAGRAARQPPPAGQVSAAEEQVLTVLRAILRFLAR